MYLWLICRQMKRSIYTLGTISGRLFIIFAPTSLLGMIYLEYLQSAHVASGSQRIISQVLTTTLALAVIGAIISAFCGLIIKAASASRGDLVPTSEPDT